MLIAILVLTTIGFCQILKPCIVVCCVFHDLLNFFLAQHTIFLSVVGLDNNHTYRTHAKEVSYLKGVRGGRMFAISKQSAGSGMARECFRGWNHPKTFCMSRHQKLAGSSIGQFVSLEFASHLRSVFGAQINRGRIATSV
ncbi:unnamed protein product [Pseudo-nitzschia multistriata]|uniref:Secreted protein n=1 Tax=Pseudo-nitzschia multistriata TaxID=183589 RepID=A0A448ZB80_9STRA|nr:unnamed protein product [Pseudo-nitzschia multistriata]